MIHYILLLNKNKKNKLKERYRLNRPNKNTINKGSQSTKMLFILMQHHKLLMINFNITLINKYRPKHVNNKKYLSILYKLNKF